jgi:predicted exporter
MRLAGTGSRVALLTLWVLALAMLGYFAQRQLHIGTDLRLFLPKPTTPQERLLLEEIGEGAGSRVLVLALSGGEPDVLADVSRELSARMQEHPAFRFVANGELSADALPEDLLAYRYLLSNTLDEHAFDVPYLREQLQARTRDLASPAGSFFEQWLASDPTLEIINVLERWQPAQEPNRLFDVWFDGQGTRALLLAETKAPAFDPDRQREAIEALRAAHREIDSDNEHVLTISGAGQFSVLMEQRTRSEAQRFGTAASIGMIALLLIAYRRFNPVFLSGLPLVSAGLVGLFVVSALFGEVHGITLAFGFTLLGVAQDYPVHLLSHWRADRPVLTVVRELWPTLATGVASTCIAYFTFVFSGVTGLQQLAAFTITGLAAASLTTRFLLPRIMGEGKGDYGSSAVLTRFWKAIDVLPRLKWTPLLLALGAIAAIAFAPTSLWDDDLSRLTPVPLELIQRDQELRSALGAADVRYMLVLDAKDREQALQTLEDLQPSLERLVRDGALSGFDHAARYLPSIETQLARRAKLPDEATLRSALQAAQAGTGFRAAVFEPFVQAVQQARSLEPLTAERLRDTSLGANLDLLLGQTPEGARAFVSLNGVQDPEALSQLANSRGDLLLLDLKGASERLVSKQRTHILWSLLIASLLLIAVVSFALRARGRVYKVLVPMAVTTVVVMATLQLNGISLSLFHLIALMLGAGLGLDYALFFEHAADDPDEQRRTLHAVIVCSLSTLMVFALLALSSIPVLRAIGLTVSLAVVSNFLLAVMVTRGTSDEAHLRSRA